jgi:SAM-dependent methyltransferase
MYSVLLPWLSLYGYRNLIGINLTFGKKVRRGPIRYEYGDITKTRFPAASFDAIACLSVIEHGVDVDLYFREMSRLLKPGALLITSTDYYDSPVETFGLKAFGVPIHVFGPKEIVQALETASSHGLEPVAELSLEWRRR